MFGLEDERYEEYQKLLRETEEKNARLAPLVARLRYEWGEWKRPFQKVMDEPESFVKALDDVLAELKDV